MYLIRVFKNREQIARKAVNAANPTAADEAGREFCRSRNGGAYSVAPVKR